MPAPPALYVGSTTLDTCLPGFRAAERPAACGAREPLVSMWLGNRTRIAAHYDLPDNLACVVAGRRRFTLFPPDELANLYIGPLDFTPAGQAISLVDFAQPDLERFPRFAAGAGARAQVAELEPGDALFIPSLWWHHVEALDAFNVLVNYWWRAVAGLHGYADERADAGAAEPCATCRRPARGLARLFDHYVFEADEDTAAHIPNARARRAGAARRRRGARAARPAAQPTEPLKA